RLIQYQEARTRQHRPRSVFFIEMVRWLSSSGSRARWAGYCRSKLPHDRSGGPAAAILAALGRVAASRANLVGRKAVCVVNAVLDRMSAWSRLREQCVAPLVRTGGIRPRDAR